MAAPIFARDARRAVVTALQWGIGGLCLLVVAAFFAALAIMAMRGEIR